jgi:hypothetical protein
MYLGWILLFTGFVLLGIAIKVRADTLAFLAKAISTKGKVIRMEEHLSTDNDDNHSYTYYPVVEFANTRGKVSQFTSKNGRNPPGFTVGQEVQVLYDPQKLNSARIATFTEIWLGSLLLGIFGLLLIVIGIILVFKRT